MCRLQFILKMNKIFKENPVEDVSKKIQQNKTVLMFLGCMRNNVGNIIRR